MAFGIMDFSPCKKNWRKNQSRHKAENPERTDRFFRFSTCQLSIHFKGLYRFPHTSDIKQSFQGNICSAGM